jgi:hypothetical protein
MATRRRQPRQATGPDDHGERTPAHRPRSRADVTSRYNHLRPTPAPDLGRGDRRAAKFLSRLRRPFRLLSGLYLADIAALDLDASLAFHAQLLDED